MTFLPRKLLERMAALLRPKPGEKSVTISGDGVRRVLEAYGPEIRQRLAAYRAEHPTCSQCGAPLAPKGGA